MASIGVNSDGRAWIKPPTKKERYYSWIDLKYKYRTVPNYNSISYKHLQSVINHGNAICRKPYIFGAGHGRSNNLRSRGYDCSSGISVTLHPIYYKSGNTTNTVGFFNWGEDARRKPKDYRQKSIIIATYGAGSKGHIWMDIWWLGNRITFDNCGSRKSSGHSMWWNNGSNPTRNSYPYKKRYHRL